MLTLLELRHILVWVVDENGELDVMLVVLSEFLQCSRHEFIKSFGVASLQNANLMVDDSVALKLAGDQE